MAVVGERRRDRRRSSRLAQAMIDVFIALAVGALVICAVVFLNPLVVGGIILVASATFLLRRWVFNWTSMMVLLTAVILFIPIRRYALPVKIGVQLEPYRFLIVILLVAIAFAATNRSRFPWQPVVWGWPIAIFLWTMLASLMFNAVTLTESGAIMGGFSNLIQLAFLMSTVVIFRQLLRSERVAMILIHLLVLGGAVVGFFAFVERRTHFNVFLQLQHFLPLVLLRDTALSSRAGGTRSYASSQHPIALSVLFCMVIPLALYLMKYSPWPRYSFTRRLLYTGAVGVMALGLLSAVSRTGIVVLAVMFLFTLLLRPRLALTLATIGLPIVALVGLVLPKLYASTVGSFLNLNSLLASQYTSVGLAGQGRLADLPGVFSGFVVHPWAGTGVGSRVVVGANANAQILDNQWLSSLLESGVVGVVGMIVLLAWPVIKMVRFSFTSSAPERRKFLVLAVAVSTVGYITAMFFYDAFAFMQTLLTLSMLYALAAWAMTDGAEAWSMTSTEAAQSARPVASRV